MRPFEQIIEAVRAALFGEPEPTPKDPQLRGDSPPTASDIPMPNPADTTIGTPGNNEQERLDEALQETFPASDPISLSIDSDEVFMVDPDDLCPIDEERLDAALLETFPASDPVSVTIDPDFLMMVDPDSSTDIEREERLDEALLETFPASDPVSVHIE